MRYEKTTRDGAVTLFMGWLFSITTKYLYIKEKLLNVSIS